MTKAPMTGKTKAPMTGKTKAPMTRKTKVPTTRKTKALMTGKMPSITRSQETNPLSETMSGSQTLTYSTTMRRAKPS